jgi:hypothetical protein
MLVKNDYGIHKLSPTKKDVKTGYHIATQTKQ